jgi:ABC-2 type transport system ATP-binding protein
MTPLLALHQASKWYGPVLALNQATLTLSAPITGLIGPNGSGKSTLIKLATGQIAPSIGTVSVRGVPAKSWQATRLVGYCPDHDAFYEDLSGRSFVYEMAKLFGYGSAEAKQRTERELHRVGMTDRADGILRGYSKGMRQRIKLAQALLHDPELLILDEPLSGIDPVGRRVMLELFRELAAGGKQLLISSHELEELEKITTNVAIMTRGRLAAVGTLDDIRHQLDDRPHTVRIDAPDSVTLAKHLLDLPGVLGLERRDTGVFVRVGALRAFSESFSQSVATYDWAVTRFEPLDDSAHSILGYVLGGSGKT